MRGVGVTIFCDSRFKIGQGKYCVKVHKFIHPFGT